MNNMDPEVVDRYKKTFKPSHKTFVDSRQFGLQKLKVN